MAFDPLGIDKEAEANLTAKERRELRDLVAVVRHHERDNPLNVYLPHEKQAAYHAAHTKIKGFFGGNRSGKTTAGIVDDIIQAVDLDAVPAHLKQFKRWNPADEPVHIRIAAPKFEDNVYKVILPTLRRWIPRSQLKGGNFQDAFSMQHRSLEFANGSMMHFLTFDQDLDAHAGAALHRVHFDEEPEGDKGLAMWTENMQRLVDYDGDFCLTMTPLFGLSWAWDEIWQHRHDDDTTVVQVDALMNPHVNAEAQAREFARMTKEERDARRYGRFVHFAGMFYPEFGDEHKRPQPDRKHIKDQDIVVGIDPGLNWTGVMWVAFDNDNSAFVFDELLAEQEVVEDVAETIKAMNKKWGIEPDYYVIDPSARNRTQINAEALQAAYLRAGVPTIQGQADRAAGIVEVKRRLQHSGIVVAETCTKLAYEFDHYRRDPNGSDEFKAVKKDDHLLDALRYVLMERPWNVDVIREPEDKPWEPGTAPSAEWLMRKRNKSSHPLGSFV